MLLTKEDLFQQDKTIYEIVRHRLTMRTRLILPTTPLKAPVRSKGLEHGESARLLRSTALRRPASIERALPLNQSSPGQTPDQMLGRLSRATSHVKGVRTHSFDILRALSVMATRPPHASNPTATRFTRARVYLTASFNISYNATHPPFTQPNSPTHPHNHIIGLARL